MGENAINRLMETQLSQETIEIYLFCLENNMYGIVSKDDIFTATNWDEKVVDRSFKELEDLTYLKKSFSYSEYVGSNTEYYVFRKSVNEEFPLIDDFII